MLARFFCMEYEKYKINTREGMFMIKDYFFSKNVEEATALLSKYAGRAMVIAGGTDLMINMANQELEAEVLVDVTRSWGFHEINLIDGYLIIGAGVTMSEAATHDLICTYTSSLAAAAASVGSVQIRNVATLAGNIIRAQPAADAAVMLAALGAAITVCGKNGMRDILVEESYAGLGRSVVDPSQEIVSKIKFKAPQKNQGSAYVRLAQRKALALPMLNVGVWLSTANRSIEDVRIIMAPVGEKPQRADVAEKYLIGKAPTAEAFQEAGVLAVKDAQPRDSFIRGSQEYRLAVLPSQVEKALAESWDEIIRKGGIEHEA